ncbi:MAG: hypothetical protein ABW123_06660, partial [Cystobacter sp.]
DVRWLVGYVDEHEPVHQHLYLDPARQHAATGEALALPVRLWRVRCDEPSGEATPCLEFGSAREEELDLLAEEIARTRPACYVDALDLSRERFALTDTVEAWRAAGLERERHVLVARREGVALAALVLERGPEGVNLRRLLDTARLFPLAPEGHDAFVALLDEARSWYASRGLSSFVLVTEADEEGALALARLREGPGASHLWMVSTHLLPEFLEHVSEATVGHLPSSAPMT